MTTTDEIFELAISWGDSRYLGKATEEEVQEDYDNLRTAIEALVAERDALKAELDFAKTNYETYQRGTQIQQEKLKAQITEQQRIIETLNAGIGCATTLESARVLDERKPVVWQSWNESDFFGYWDTREEAELNSAHDFEPVPLYRSQS